MYEAGCRHTTDSGVRGREPFTTLIRITQSSGGAKASSHACV